MYSHIYSNSNIYIYIYIYKIIYKFGNISAIYMRVQWVMIGKSPQVGQWQNRTNATMAKPT